MCRAYGCVDMWACWSGYARVRACVRACVLVYACVRVLFGRAGVLHSQLILSQTSGTKLDVEEIVEGKRGLEPHGQTTAWRGR